MSNPPVAKADIIALIRARWEALQALVRSLSAADMEQPLGDGWSAKVHLAHIAAWERSLAALLRGQDRATAMGVAAAVWATDDVDAMNQMIAEGAAAQPLDVVLADANQTHAHVVALLDAMSQADFELPYAHYQPADPEVNPAPVVGWVHGDTWEHYDEHIGWLEARLSAR